MAVRIEIILLGGGPNVFAPNIVREVIKCETIESGGTFDVPNVLADGGMYARLTSIGGPSYVAWGTNPTASGELTEKEMRLVEGLPEALAVKGGYKLSVVDGD